MGKSGRKAVGTSPDILSVSNEVIVTTVFAEVCSKSHRVCSYEILAELRYHDPHFVISVEN